MCINSALASVIKPHMKLLDSRPILYFVLGLLAGTSLSCLFVCEEKYSLSLETLQLEQLLSLLLHLTIWGVMLGALITLLSRGLALIFLDETQNPK